MPINLTNEKVYLPTYRPRDRSFRSAFIQNFIDYLGTLNSKYLNITNPKLSEIGKKSVAKAKATINEDIPVVNKTTKIRKMWKSQKEAVPEGTVFEIAGSKALNALNKKELKAYFKSIGLAEFIDEFVLRRWKKKANDVDPRTTIPSEDVSPPKDEEPVISPKTIRTKIDEGSFALLRHLADVEEIKYDKDKTTFKQLLELLGLKSVISYDDFRIILLKGCDAGTGVYKAFCLCSDSNLHLVFLFKDIQDEIGDIEIEIHTTNGESFLQALVSKGLGFTRPIDAEQRDYKTFFNILLKLSQGEPCQVDKDYVVLLNTFLQYCQDKDSTRIAELLHNIVGNHSQDSQNAMISILLNFEWTLHLGDKELAKKFTPEFIQEIWEKTFKLDSFRSSFLKCQELKKQNPILLLKLQKTPSDLIGGALFAGGTLTAAVNAHYRKSVQGKFDSALTRHLNQPMVEAILPFDKVPEHLKGIQEGHSQFLEFDPLRWAQTIDKHFASQPALYNSDRSDILETLFTQSCNPSLFEGETLSQIQAEKEHLLTQEDELIPLIEKFTASKNTFLIQAAASLATILTALGSQRAKELLFINCLPALKPRNPELAQVIKTSWIRSAFETDNPQLLEKAFAELQTFNNLPENEGWNYWLLCLLEKFPDRKSSCIHLLNPSYLPAHIQARWLILAEDVEQAMPVLDLHSVNPRIVLERIKNESDLDTVFKELQKVYPHELEPEQLKTLASIIVRLLPASIQSKKHDEARDLFDLYGLEEYVDKEALAASLNTSTYHSDFHSSFFYWLGIAIGRGIDVPKQHLNSVFGKELKETNQDWAAILGFLGRVSKNTEWMDKYADVMGQFAQFWAQKALDQVALSPVVIAGFPFSTTVVESPKGIAVLQNLLQSLMDINTPESLTAAFPLLKLIDNANISIESRTNLNRILKTIHQLLKSYDLKNETDAVENMQSHCEMVFLASHLYLDLAHRGVAESLLLLFNRINVVNPDHLEKLRIITLHAIQSNQLTSSEIVELLKKPNALALLGESIWFECILLWMKQFPFNSTRVNSYMEVLKLFLDNAKLAHASKVAGLILETKLLNTVYSGHSIIWSKLSLMFPAIEESLHPVFFAEAITIATSLPPEEYHCLTEIYLCPGISPSTQLNKVLSVFKKMATYDLNKALKLLKLYPHLNTKENWALIWKQKQKLENASVLQTALELWKPRIAVDKDVETGSTVLNILCSTKHPDYTIFLDDIPYLLSCVKGLNNPAKDTVVTELLTLLKNENDENGFKLLFKAAPPKCTSAILHLHLHSVRLDDSIEDSCIECIKTLLASKQETIRAETIVKLNELLKNKSAWTNTTDTKILEKRKEFFALFTSIVQSPLLYDWLLDMPLNMRDSVFLKNNLLKDLQDKNKTWTPELLTKISKHIDEKVEKASLEEIKVFNQVTKQLQNKQTGELQFNEVRVKVVKALMKAYLTAKNIPSFEIQLAITNYLTLGINDYHNIAIHLLCRIPMKDNDLESIFRAFAPKFFRPENIAACFEAFCIYTRYNEKVHHHEATRNLQVLLKLPNLLEFQKDLLEKALWLFFTFPFTSESKQSAINALQKLEPFSNRHDCLGAWEIATTDSQALVLSPTNSLLVNNLTCFARGLISHAPQRFVDVITACKIHFKLPHDRFEAANNFTILVNSIVNVFIEESTKATNEQMERLVQDLLPLFFILPNDLLNSCEAYLTFLLKLYKTKKNKEFILSIYGKHCEKYEALQPATAIFCNNATQLHWLLRRHAYKNCEEKIALDDLQHIAEEEFIKICRLPPEKINDLTTNSRLFFSILFQLFNYKYTENKELQDYGKLQEFIRQVSGFLCDHKCERARDRLYYYVFNYDTFLLDDDEERKSFLLHLQSATERDSFATGFLTKKFSRHYSFAGLLPLQTIFKAFMTIFRFENPSHAPLAVASIDVECLFNSLKLYIDANVVRMENTFWIRGIIRTLPNPQALVLLNYCVELAAQVEKPFTVIFYLTEHYHYIRDDFENRHNHFERYIRLANRFFASALEVNKADVKVITQFFNCLVTLARSEHDFNRILPLLWAMLMTDLDINYSTLFINPLHGSIVNSIRTCQPNDLDNHTMNILDFNDAFDEILPKKQIKDLEIELVTKLYEHEKSESLQSHLDVVLVDILEPEASDAFSAETEGNVEVWVEKVHGFCNRLLEDKQIKLLAQFPSRFYKQAASKEEETLNRYFNLLEERNDDTNALLLNLLKEMPFRITPAQQERLAGICAKHAEIYDKSILTQACLESSNVVIKALGLDYFKTLAQSPQRTSLNTSKSLLLCFPTVKFESMKQTEQCELYFEALMAFHKIHHFDQDFFKQILPMVLQKAENLNELQSILDKIIKQNLINLLNIQGKKDFALYIASQIAILFLAHDNASDLEAVIESVATKLQGFFKNTPFPKNKGLESYCIAELSTNIMPHNFKASFYLMVLDKLHANHEKLVLNQEIINKINDYTYQFVLKLITTKSPWIHSLLVGSLHLSHINTFANYVEFAPKISALMDKDTVIDSISPEIRVIIKLFLTLGTEIHKVKNNTSLKENVVVSLGKIFTSKMLFKSWHIQTVTAYILGHVYTNKIFDSGVANLVLRDLLENFERKCPNEFPRDAVSSALIETCWIIDSKHIEYQKRIIKPLVEVLKKYTPEEIKNGHELVAFLNGLRIAVVNFHRIDTELYEELVRTTNTWFAALHTVDKKDLHREGFAKIYDDCIAFENNVLAGEVAALEEGF